jgi:hypothetical protein
MANPVPSYGNGSWDTVSGGGAVDDRHPTARPSDRMDVDRIEDPCGPPTRPAGDQQKSGPALLAMLLTSLFSATWLSESARASRT